MSLHSDDPEDGDRLAFEGELTIYTAAESYARLRDFLAEREQCALDLSGVSELDCAGMQFLLWVRQLAEREGKHLSLAARSQVVDEAIRLLHLDAAFGLDLSHPDQDGVQ